MCATCDLDQAVLPAAVFLLNESPGLVFWGRCFSCSLTGELIVKACAFQRSDMLAPNCERKQGKCHIELRERESMSDYFTGTLLYNIS